MKNLYLGDEDLFVKYLQLALIRAGYEVLLDGVYGPETNGALSALLGRENVVQVDWAIWRKVVPFLKGYETYLVKEGDTPESIAESHNSTVSLIRVANMADAVPLHSQLSSQQDLETSQAMSDEQDAALTLTPGQELIIPFDYPIVPENVPYSARLVHLIIEGLTVRYPFMHQRMVGSSVMGRNLYALHIGSGSQEVFYNASFHANEWITTPILLKFAEEYGRAYSNNELLYGAGARELFQNYSLYLVPLVNPDGMDLVTGAITNDNYYTMAREISDSFPDIPFPEGWKANIAGTDLNLQFPAGWEMAKSIKYAQGYRIPAPRDYVGESPLSAPESKAIYDFTLEHDFQLIISYHTQGQVIYWKYLDYDPENAQSIGEYFSSVSGYVLEETPYASGFAGYKDWFIQNYNRPGYTIEAGLGDNPLPLTDFPEIYQQNREILVGGMFMVSGTMNKL